MHKILKNIEKFSAGNGWFDGFNRSSTPFTICTQWIEDLPIILNEYSPDDVYKADEKGLFFKCLPDKTYTFIGNQYTGGKLSNDCANMTGTEKLPLFLIGKSKNFRCFEGVVNQPVEDKD